MDEEPLLFFYRLRFESDAHDTGDNQRKLFSSLRAFGEPRICLHLGHVPASH